MMTRKAALAACKAAGTENDQRAFLRIYTENRISYQTAIAAFREGQRWAQFVAARDDAASLSCST